MATRIADFRKELTRQFEFAKKPAERTWQIIRIVLAAVGLTAWAAFRAASEYLAGHEMLSAILGVVAWALGLWAIAFIAWNAAIAWDRSRPPLITVRQLELDVPYSHFYMTVTVGDVPTKVQGFVRKAVGSDGARRIEHPWQGHLRGRSPFFNDELIPNAPVEYGWLGVATYAESGNPTLFIWSADQTAMRQLASGHGMVPISKDAPLAEQDAVTLEVAITCATATGRPGQPHYFRFSVAPDPGSAVGYKIIDPGTPMSVRDR